MNQTYVDSVGLLLDVAPAVFRSPCFAMKGGTALNLFLQDMPRLSVDIDVVFTDHTLARDEALQQIAAELTAVRARVEAMGYAAEVRSTRQGDETKLFVASDRAEVKVEVNYVLRGVLLPVRQQALSPATQALFSQSITLPTLDPAELYGSKLVAALDCQHPRDLFDVRIMLDRFGLNDDILNCFVAYLAAHNRPIHEVLFPRPKPLAVVFRNQFLGMTREPIPLETLEATQIQLFRDLPRALSAYHRAFLLSLVEQQPEWERLPFPHLPEMPAIRWKLANLSKLRGPRRTAQADLLRQSFEALDHGAP